MTPAPESAGPDGLVRKAYHQDSVLLAANPLREARRQRELPDVPVPPVCLLDPDGDIVQHLRANGLGHPHPGWACYHTQMWVTELDGR